MQTSNTHMRRSPASPQATHNTTVTRRHTLHQHYTTYAVVATVCIGVILLIIAWTPQAEAATTTSDAVAPILLQAATAHRASMPATSTSHPLQPRLDTALPTVLAPMASKAQFKFYGKWCGPGHGGYQDCCNGSACPECVWQRNNNSEPTKECLKACPPVDSVDFACAAHDLCTFHNDLSPNTTNNFSCKAADDNIPSNFCQCDCLLVVALEKACPSLWQDGVKCIAADVMAWFFSKVSACWYWDDATPPARSCDGAPWWTGDHKSHDYPLNKYCAATLANWHKAYHNAN
eukprot:TRINITY_DN1854_c0_g1_i1.p1 TRINITY_DN1854_c0_g1~~TRINITY_DN1854_c0_g1_i1.p1  ORF type:complete len:290 (-),score=35.05 TRINITY_DN1854_c0_g1_i1:14-883(-)